uniref:LOW QUALITY PROTEIN: macrophage mannose receptor 1-like n=1 Tax=Styela clava TaxID=7725 RepID=UPI001939727B|nr:LOW QUALITY PROTEIN: macrophage mannose receptor 1-like [Styela clava]
MWKEILHNTVFALLISGCVSVCPSDWEENNGKCYFFSFGKVAVLPWHQAQSQCESLLGNLVVIDDALENDFIANRMGNAFDTFIGLHDLNQYDDWQWVDGSPLTFTNWIPGQPDHWDSAPGGTENCVALPRANKGLWNDQSCSIASSYICERTNDLDTIPKCNVQDGWQELMPNRCYLFVSDAVSWTTANEQCKSMGADLVAITSDAEQRAISVEIVSKNKNTWMGLSTVNHVSQDFYWSNEVDSYSDLSYNNWADSEPVVSSYSTCVELTPDAANYSPWKTQRCGEEHSYMCESAPTGSCADGWRLSVGRCYLFVLAQNAWGTWVDARDYCKAMGANILVIETEEEQQYISQALPDFVDAGAQEFWLGISDSIEDGNFMWEDEANTPVSSGSYINWNKNQPLNREDTWDCVQVYTGFYLGRWETADCFQQQPYICEMDPGVEPKPIVPIANTHKGCDPGWLWFDGNCYYFNYDKMIQWSEAELKCIEMNSHLTSVHSGEENSFIIDHTSASTWIGGHAVLNLYAFQWSDNSPWDFTNWAAGEPNNLDQGCAQLWDAAGYMWDDAACTVLKNYACKKAEQDCWEPLGMEDRRILDAQITSSSDWNANHAARFGRLNNYPDGSNIGAWACGGDTQQPDVAWFQVQLVPQRTVFGITTQGRPRDHDQYVKSYKVSYSDDGNSWTFIKDNTGTDKIYVGNTDMNSKVTNKLPDPIVTKYIRIWPMTYFGHMSMRVELLGCQDDGDDLPTISPQTECTSVSYQDRLDCGYPGVTATECRNRGCCWDNGVPDTIWCFYKQDDYDPRCGKDWIYDPGGQFFCYHFNPYKIRDWQDAQLHCYNLGGDLLSINSMHEQYYVTAHVTGLVSASALWIGANQLDKSAGWKWTDGGPFNYKYWRSGEPNNWTGEEDCVEMYTYDGTWNDNPCFYQRGIACKKQSNNFPISQDDDGNYVENICEGETGTLFCGGNLVILVHHASYGRNNPLTCGGGDAVPSGGCHTSSSFELVSQQCNGRSSCQLSATNENFGDPCVGTYKYLNIIYSCETNTCLEQLGMENGTISDSMISESSSIDSSHSGKNGRLNSARSWATNGGEGAWIQVLLPKHQKVSGIKIQGANDADRWVTTFKISYAKDASNTEWIEYENYDNIVEVFTGSSDKNTVNTVLLAERVYTTGIRLYPVTWNGNTIGMRMDIMGCNPFQEITCNTIGDEIFVSGDADTETTREVDCPSYCTEILAYQYDIYGDLVYSGNSQVCSAAIHAGVLLDRLGGAVTLKAEMGLSSYKGTERHGVHSQDLDRYTPLAFSFTNAEMNCPTGWLPYDQFCYMIISDEVPWQSGEVACQLMNANLVSIKNPAEQDFVWQVMTLSGQTDLWIGLSSVISANEYQWTDGTLVIYTEWDVRQPDRSVQSCAHLSVETGKWDDDICELLRPFMCKMSKGYYTHDPGSEPTVPPGCDEGWVPYHGLCYLFDRQPFTYQDSKKFCTDNGGEPVAILDKYTQSFLHTIIGAEDFRWWLGLTGTPIIGGSSWTWENGYPLNAYDNWGFGNPDITNGECAVFYGGQIGSGMWYSYRCENHAFSICQSQRVGYTPPPKTTPPPSGGCPGDWWTPDENSGFCYRAYMPEGNAWDVPVSWNNAYHQCLATGGDLVSIHSVEEDTFLLTLLKNTLGGESYGFWIGLNSKATTSEIIESGWEWTDGSAVNYLSWSPGYPDNLRERSCVELRYEGDLGLGAWRNIDCNQQRDWICKLKKGIDVVSPTEPPAGNPNPQCGSADDGTWIEYDGWCYLFNDFEMTNFHAAEDTCMTNGGHLISLHSHNEQSFVTGQLKTFNRTIRFWIGMQEFGGVDGEFVWLDGTPIDFVNWNPGEPNDTKGSEQCVEILQRNGKWNDGNCALEIAGYICKKRLGDPPNPPQPTEQWPGGCPSEWLMYDNYCYQVHGEYTVCATDSTDWSDGECRAGWYEARDKCRDIGGDLVTIHNKYENAFVSAQIMRVPTNVWIGMNDEHWYDQYTWSTGEQVTYTNWYTGEPNHWNNEERCVEMHHREDVVGRWNDIRCDNAVSYVCQMKKDPTISEGLQINNNNKCPKGWLQYDTINGNYICYYLEMMERSFDDSIANCRKMKSGANLASYQTMYEQHFVTSYIRDTTAWIGMRYDMDGDEDSNQWKWVDDWPVWISNWGEYEPGSDLNKLVC